MTKMRLLGVYCLVLLLSITAAVGKIGFYSAFLVLVGAVVIPCQWAKRLYYRVRGSA